MERVTLPSSRAQGVRTTLVSSAREAEVSRDEARIQSSHCQAKDEFRHSTCPFPSYELMPIAPSENRTLTAGAGVPRSSAPYDPNVLFLKTFVKVSGGRPGGAEADLSFPLPSPPSRSSGSDPHRIDTFWRRSPSTWTEDRIFRFFFLHGGDKYDRSRRPRVGRREKAQAQPDEGSCSNLARTLSMTRGVPIFETES